jgi:maltose alpha-D-glucosyltransferase/alpha-amylase
MSRRPSAASQGADGATWYKDAIIYELRTRSFYDSNGDGIGDFRGLTSKLDYLEDLGVTALWLLPFYPSPGRDDGYDISDYVDVHPEVGTLADFEAFVEDAHGRGIRVITELVLNHTSDQHPWFQRARRAPKGSPERDFYVWSATPDRYKDARIIFKDFEPSNWSWDRQAEAYYWHRFYSHQPDLNFENPAVQEALLSVVDFWLGKGVDGLRLDAVPYLYEQDGTNCENLAPTHLFLKKLRAHIDARFENRMLLAEANQWPEDAAAYFGQGDECHMNFHFPLMPRMFMSIHMEDRLPIVDIFAQTPDVHPACQWALFLRNHDELTLEMVTDEERDYMYRAYARQMATRINLGIRRRLAPLVDNSRRKMELLNGLLLSLPGTPVLYYGDEIGMGDNVYLGDRNGVRTPMQWNMDRNAGFSSANPQRLVLPVVIDPEYHYESLNVENQQQNPTSLLWWTKRLIALRKRFTAFGRGTTRFLNPSNSRVLAFIRQHNEECVLVVANLSRFSQCVELDLATYKGSMPVEVFGKTRFPAVGEDPYPLTLGPHGFYWFALERAGTRELGTASPSVRPVPSFECEDVETLLRSAELGDALRGFLETRPWFAGRDRAIRASRVADVFKLDVGSKSVFVALVGVESSDFESDVYVIPLALVKAEMEAEETSVFAYVEIRGDDSTQMKWALVDALEEPVAARTLLEAFAETELASGQTGKLRVSVARSVALAEPDLRPDPRKMGRESHDTTLRYGDRFVLKVLRRLDVGVSPELEIAQFLASRGSDLAPRVEAWVEFVRPRAEPQTVAILQSFVPHLETAWRFTQEELSRYYERTLARPADDPPPPVQSGSPLLLAGALPPALVTQMIGNYLDTAATLGRRIAELHVALAGGATPAFAAEPYSALDRRSKYQSLRNLSGRILRLLREQLTRLAPAARGEAERVLASETELLERFEPLLRMKTGALRIRVHGDLHLGHLLYTGKDFVLTGIGGAREPSFAAPRRKRSPLSDLAGMVRSFDFAAMKLLLDPARVRDADVDAARPWALHWSAWVSASFLGGYVIAAQGAPFVPSDRDEFARLLDAFVLERALFELKSELMQRVDAISVAVPLVGISRILSAPFV